MFGPVRLRLRSCLCECSCRAVCVMEDDEVRCDTCAEPICLDCAEHHGPFCAAVAAGVTTEDIEAYARERGWS